jgi:hypothetical protein
MKKSEYTEQRIAFALQQAERGTTVMEQRWTAQSRLRDFVLPEEFRAIGRPLGKQSIRRPRIFLDTACEKSLTQRN